METIDAHAPLLQCFKDVQIVTWYQHWFKTCVGLPTATSLTLTDARALPSVSPVCDPDVGTLELWVATWKMRKSMQSTPSKKYTSNKRPTNKKTPQQTKSICFAFTLVFFLIPLVDLGNRKETISLQQLLLDQSFICCWLVMWSIMINHMQDYLKIIPVYKWQHPTEAV